MIAYVPSRRGINNHSHHSLIGSCYLPILGPIEPRVENEVIRVSNFYRRGSSSTAPFIFFLFTAIYTNHTYTAVSKMVKILENSAVDLDIAPGSKDGGELKDKADALTYLEYPPRSAIFQGQIE